MSIRGTSTRIRARHQKRNSVLLAHSGMLTTPLVSQFNHLDPFFFPSPVAQLLIGKALNATKKQKNAKTTKLLGKSTDNHLRLKRHIATASLSCVGAPPLHSGSVLDGDQCSGSAVELWNRWFSEWSSNVVASLARFSNYGLFFRLNTSRI